MGLKLGSECVGLVLVDECHEAEVIRMRRAISSLCTMLEKPSLLHRRYRREKCTSSTSDK